MARFSRFIGPAGSWGFMGVQQNSDSSNGKNSFHTNDILHSDVVQPGTATAPGCLSEYGK